MNKYLKITLSIVVVAGLATGGIKTLKDAKAKDASLSVAKVYPIVAQTLILKSKNIELTLPYLAQVANDKDVKLSPRIAARVIKITASGTRVKKGDIVARLDTTNIKSSIASLKNQIKAVRVAVKNLQRTHKRTLELLDIQGASIEQSQKETTLIASEESKLNALKQQEITLRNNLSYATIVSPVNGIISKTFVNRGALSTPGHSLVAISSKNGFYLMLRVPTDLNVAGVKLDSKTYRATPLGSTFHGLAEYKVYTSNSNLISGDRVEVDVIVYNQKGLKLPFDAVLNRNGKSYVLVVEGTKANAKEVHILQSAEQGLVISDNLEGKQVVIAKPDILLKLLSGFALSIKE